MATRMNIEPQKLIGFAPDLDPSTPGIFQDCNNVVPTLIGFKGAASPINGGLATLNKPALGSALLLLLDGTARMFAGTQSNLYEDVAGAWVDQSAAGGYALGSDSKWRFAAFGNACLAVNGQTVLQSSLSSGFTNVPVALSGITVTAGGSGYVSPTITISAPNISSGIHATATATVVSGVITAITLTNSGSGYTSAPTITITDSAGTGAAATAQIVSAPIGKIIFVANGQVFVCNCSNPPQVAGGDFWFCSGIYDHTQWDTTNMQTLCAYGPLIDTPGPITAGAAIGPNAVIFKENSMYLGTQTGYPVGWDFQAVSKSVGALNHECVVTVANTLYFIGPDDFYAYQGNGLPVPIGQNVRRWFFNTLDINSKGNISSFYDKDQKVIYWGFPSNNSSNGAIDTCICYNWSTGTWGVLDAKMECFVTILNGEITYNSLGTEWNTYNDLPGISYDSSFWNNFRTTPGYFDSTNTLQALAGTSKGATITTNAFGDDMVYSTMQQFRIRFKTQPSSGTAVWQGKTTLGSSDPSTITNVNAGPLVLADSRIDVDQSNRWHNLILTFDGDFEAMEWVPSMVQLGRN